MQNVSLNISGVHEKENMVVLQTSQNNIGTVNKLLVDGGVNVSGINQKRRSKNYFYDSQTNKLYTHHVFQIASNRIV